MRIGVLLVVEGSPRTYASQLSALITQEGAEFAFVRVDSLEQVGAAALELIGKSDALVIYQADLLRSSAISGAIHRRIKEGIRVLVLARPNQPAEPNESSWSVLNEFLSVYDCEVTDLKIRPKPPGTGYTVVFDRYRAGFSFAPGGILRGVERIPMSPNLIRYWGFSGPVLSATLEAWGEVNVTNRSDLADWPFADAPSIVRWCGGDGGDLMVCGDSDVLADPEPGNSADLYGHAVAAFAHRLLKYLMKSDEENLAYYLFERAEKNLALAVRRALKLEYGEHWKGNLPKDIQAKAKSKQQKDKGHRRKRRVSTSRSPMPIESYWDLWQLVQIMEANKHAVFDNHLQGIGTTMEHFKELFEEFNVSTRRLIAHPLKLALADAGPLLPDELQLLKEVDHWARQLNLAVPSGPTT